ncbi:MAG: peptidoglycan -binding protein [Geminicoccales bacterium]
MARSRRDQRQNGADIWPGFVDALSTLLLVIIFLLVVFVLGQFFLSRLLEGKDSKLLSLEQAISELNDQLSLEQDTNAQLRRSVAQLTSDLQTATLDRDQNNANLSEITAERDEYRDQLIVLEEDKKLLAQTLAELRQDQEQNDDIETDLARANQLRAELEEELERATQTVDANAETLKARLAELVQLKRDIVALTETRRNLELDIGEMTALLRAAEQAKADAADEIARLSALLKTAQAESADLQDQVADLGEASEQAASLETRLSELTALLKDSETGQEQSEARISALEAELEQVRADLENERASKEQAIETAEDELARRERRIAELAAELEVLNGTRDTANTDLEELQRAREALLVELSQVRDRAAQLEARLAGEQDRTLLAQRELEQRAIQIAELLRSTGQNNEALSTERKLSREAFAQIDTLNRQINSLRNQLATLADALAIEQEKVSEQDVIIADLGKQLNVALVGKVEELSRFRSEFFGRLSEVLGNRTDVKVQGDRFVFQSEVLFPSGEAVLEPSGRDQLATLAESLRDISSEIPGELPWVLQINGHTDRRRINTAEFPSNWELSTARAITVGKFLIDNGVPEERIAVAGFAQYQPVDERRSNNAYRNNRRIEIKLTTP